MLESRTDQPKKAVATFRRFERTWPESKYLPYVSHTMGMYAMEQNDYKEMESRFRTVMESDLPVETKLNVQGLLVWCLLEQGRKEEAIPLVESLFPIGRSKPDERGMMAIMQVQCDIKDIEGAKKTRASYLTAYRNGPLRLRFNLMWGLLAAELGQLDAESAKALQDVMKEEPSSESADEIRITLATLLANGELPEKANPDNDTVQSLISGLKSEGTSGDAKQRALLLQTRLAFAANEWDKVLGFARAFEKAYPKSPRLGAVLSFRDQTNEILEKNRRDKFREAVRNKGALEAMPMLTAGNIQMLTPEMRAWLVSTYVAKGLPEAASKIIKASPNEEKAELRQILTDYVPDPLPPPKVLASIRGDLMGHKGALGQVQTLLQARKWNEASNRIEKLDPGPDRVKAVMTLLLRPMTPSEAQLRRKEAEGWLSRLQENVSDTEPLVILIADLHMQADGAKAALDIYPERALPENQGWVSLMRATALARLGNKDEARRVLGENATVPEFRQHRRALANQLARETGQ
jgi:tetratricopeptide (TPR) repeat protein